MAVDGCKAMQGQGGNIVYSACSASTFLLRELFLSSDGADIDQSFAQTEGFAIAICSGEHGNFELYDFTGHQRGWEVLSEGYSNGPIVLPDFMDFCQKLGADAVGPFPDQVGLYHMAWELADMDELKDAYHVVLDNNVEIAGFGDHGETKGLYIRDPDGIEIELFVAAPEFEKTPLEEILTGASRQGAAAG